MSEDSTLPAASPLPESTRQGHASPLAEAAVGRDEPRGNALPLQETVPAADITLPGPASPLEETVPASVSARLARAVAELPLVDTGLYVKEHALGRGGMGETNAAFERRLGRTVAVKEIRSDRDPELFQAGFEREARLTARLQHPSIVSVYEAGMFGPGRPFYAMRLIEGAPFAEEIAKRTDLAARLSLVPSVLKVIQAIAYAHGQRVVHRDIKPANIVVGKFGEVVVIDWGLAWELDDPATTVPAAGTPQYWPPEQAKGDLPVPASDVYSLGATLYHVLAGVPPYGQAKDAYAVLKGPPEPLSILAKGAPRELVAIVEKAMQRDVARRYATASELADDLARFLDGRLVEAYEYSKTERLLRWLRRNRVPVAIAAVALVVTATVATMSIRRIIDARHETQQRADELVLARARDLLSSDPTASLAMLAEYPDEGPDSTEAGLVAIDATSRGIARHVFASNGRRVNDVATSRDERWAASAGGDGTIRLWDLQSGKETLLATLQVPAKRVAFSPDGIELAGTTSDGSIYLWALASMRRREVKAGTGSIDALAWSPDGKRLATGGEDQTVRIWDRAHLQASETRIGYDVYEVVFSPDSSLVAVAGRGNDAILLRSASEQIRLRKSDNGDVFSIAFGGDGAIVTSGRGHVCVWIPPYDESASCIRQEGVVRRAVFAHQGNSVVFGNEAGEVKVWKWRTSEPPPLLGRHSAAVMDLALSSDGTTLVSGGWDGSIRSWSLSNGVSRTMLGQHEVTRVTVVGSTIVTAGFDHTVRVWPIVEDRSRQPTGADVQGSDVAWMPDGSLVVASRGTLRRWSTPESAPQLIQIEGAPMLRRIVPLGGAVVAAVGGDSVLRVVDFDTNKVVNLEGHSNEVFDVAALPNGDVVTGGIDGSVRVWQRTANSSRLIAQHRGGVWTVATSSDGQFVASSGFDGTIRWSSVASEKSVTLGKHHGYVNAVSITPDGRHVISAGTDEAVGVWPTSGLAPPTMLENSSVVTTVAILDDPTGYSIISGERDGSVRTRSITTGSGIALARHHAALRSIAVSKSGRWVATGSVDGEISIVDTRTRITHIHQLGGEVRRLAFSPDGKQLAATGGASKIWPIDDIPAASLTTTARFSRNGVLATPTN